MDTSFLWKRAIDTVATAWKPSSKYWWKQLKRKLQDVQFSFLPCDTEMQKKSWNSLNCGVFIKGLLSGNWSLTIRVLFSLSICILRLSNMIQIHAQIWHLFRDYNITWVQTLQDALVVDTIQNMNMGEFKAIVTSLY